jgi:hypothetical protein
MAGTMQTPCLKKYLFKSMDYTTNPNATSKKAGKTRDFCRQTATGRHLSG